MLFLMIILRVSLFLAAMCFGVVAGAHWERHQSTAWVALAMAVFLAVAFAATFVKERD